MAAVKLVTRCPACRTAFRLVADQLRLRQGLVRCGQCETVFDAREHLIEIPLPAGTSAVSAPAQKPAASATASTPATPAAPAPAAAEAATPPASAPALAGQMSAPKPAFTPTIDPGYDVPALDAPTMLMSSPEDTALPPQAGMDDAEIERALREANAAVADRDARDAQRQAADAVAEAAPVPAPAAKQPTPPAAWPALDHGALDSAAGTPAAPAPGAIPSASEFLRAASADTAPEPAPWPDHTPLPADTPSQPAWPASPDAAPAAGDEDQATAAAADTIASATGGAVAREQVTRRWVRAEAPAGPVFAPDFLRHAREREREREPRRPIAVPRAAWPALAVVLAIAALLQLVYLGRSQLAGHFPMLRPALEAACAPPGCTVPPWRDIDALRIETSQLQRQDEGGDTYLLAVTLRNQGRASTALPAIELVMTDLQDQLLLRRVLQPAEYLEPSQQAFAAQGLRAGMELPVRVRFRTQQAPANYRVLIFYP
ncbi:DUF3426 domain-containing protein [Cupriavidus taiwanensis]|uniref:DUF3426 domain-containing protein n=1 Tax=Cupriavidus taiwanensis TaxID=164546 RepID=UPI000E10B24E|nr:DUF3426 domain-containing protein [Cupriavidus taiwanensis]SOY50534.1 Conserved hypothetical protein [Cupriavidus taiwanensis]SOY50778.1 Conserved hypothetical protein [Cupriavidus taiwanensis]SOY83697.1 Conserved hypothetical protein [Cupriavidus taiwanensis]SOZ57895.1 Conserved hypothetical protein [Cupriavidus taiwanensis]SOZ79732.1 Conserved hypothetical protein [Cupriavidus taiwanensis]